MANATLAKTSNLQTSYGMEEDKWISINPKGIDVAIFQEERDLPEQENLRKLILQAFDEARLNPKYCKTFETMVPKESRGLSINDLIDESIFDGCEIINWIHQGLEWAYRITKGEPWENICENADNSTWYKLMFWQDGIIHTVGGSKKISANVPETTVMPAIMDYDFITDIAVPKYVRYK